MNQLSSPIRIAPFSPYPEPFPEEARAWAPLPPPWSECRSDGDLLVTSRESMLPPRCVKCGDKMTERRTAKIYWHSPWWYLAIVFGFWAYLIADGS